MTAPTGPGGQGPRTQRERNAEKREQKLREIDEAVRDGGLVIRQMTPEERKKLPERPRRTPRKS